MHKTSGKRSGQTNPSLEETYNTPLDSELLDHDDGASFLSLADLRKIDWYLSGSHTHTDTIEEATGNEHAPRCASDLNARPCNPPQA